MKTTLATRKINLVQNFLALDNQETIAKVEVLLQEEKTRLYEESISKQMTHSDLNDMLNKAEDDFKNGRVISAEDLLEKIKSW